MTYRLSTSATATGPTAGTGTVVNKGRIVGVKGIMSGGAGAGQGRCSAEVTLNQNASSFAESNMPSRETTLTMLTVQYQTSLVGQAIGTYVPLDIPVSPGNTLNVNMTQIGVAPTAQLTVFEVYVVES